MDRLTEREAEILGLMAMGLSNGAICERLYISPKTVERHISAIFHKLDLAPAGRAHRRVLAVLQHLEEHSPVLAAS